MATNTAPMMGQLAPSLKRPPRWECCPGHTPFGDPKIQKSRIKRREAATWKRDTAGLLGSAGGR